MALFSSRGSRTSQVWASCTAHWRSRATWAALPPSVAKFAEPDKGRWHAACLESGGDEDEMLEMAVRREPRLQETGRCREEVPC